MELSIGWMIVKVYFHLWQFALTLYIQSGPQKLEACITFFFNYFGKIVMQ